MGTGLTALMRYRTPKPPEDGGYPGFRPGTVIEDGLRIDRDVAVQMRDGTPIYVDVYRSAQQVDEVPALIAWGAYGKHGGPAIAIIHRPEAEVDPQWVSKHAATEAPDPLWWCSRGYAVIFPIRAEHGDRRGRTR